jgi:hypothetical protein
MVTSTLPLPTPARTVKIRVAVAIDSLGAWNAVGWGAKNPIHQAKRDDEAMDCAIDGIGDGEARFWLEVELPVPQAVTLTPLVTSVPVEG